MQRGFLSETGSESFEKFLSLLGDSITLQGWAGYRGGLDTKSKRALARSARTCTHCISTNDPLRPVLFSLRLFDLQTTQQGSSPFTRCTRATSSCSTCPPCCRTPKRTNSRRVPMHTYVCVSDCVSSGLTRTTLCFFCLGKCLKIRMVCMFPVPDLVERLHRCSFCCRRHFFFFLFLFFLRCY